MLRNKVVHNPSSASPVYMFYPSSIRLNLHSINGVADSQRPLNHTLKGLKDQSHNCKSRIFDSLQTICYQQLSFFLINDSWFEIPDYCGRNSCVVMNAWAMPLLWKAGKSECVKCSNPLITENKSSYIQDTFHSQFVRKKKTPPQNWKAFQFQLDQYKNKHKLTLAANISTTFCFSGGKRITTV